MSQLPPVFGRSNRPSDSFDQIVCLASTI